MPSRCKRKNVPFDLFGSKKSDFFYHPLVISAPPPSFKISWKVSAREESGRIRTVVLVQTRKPYTFWHFYLLLFFIYFSFACFFFFIFCCLTFFIFNYIYFIEPQDDYLKIFIHLRLKRMIIKRDFVVRRVI